MAVVTLPRYFEKAVSTDIVHLDRCSSVFYNQSIKQEKVSVCITKSMFAIILKGRKIIHTECGDISISSREMFFAQRGAYLLSERMNIDGEYQSLIFFIDDTYLQEFTIRNRELIVRSKSSQQVHSGIYKIAKSPLLSMWVDSVLPVFHSDYSNRKQILNAKLEELLQLLMNTEKRDQLVDFLYAFQYPKKRNLKMYMEENFMFSLTLEEFAMQSGRSLTAFKKEFKEVFKLSSPKKWINAKRLERAHMLLSNTEMTVTDVCYETGFENISHFIKLFSERYGMTPKKLQMDINGL
jgi:AraC-like DNA-binding protein